MAYKDKDRQREANRRAQAKFKAKAKGITEQGITEDIKQGITDLEKCWCCGADLPPLEQPRKRPGACGPCCWSGRTKTSPILRQHKAVKTFNGT